MAVGIGGFRVERRFADHAGGAADQGDQLHLAFGTYDKIGAQRLLDWRQEPVGPFALEIRATVRRTRRVIGGARIGRRRRSGSR